MKCCGQLAAAGRESGCQGGESVPGVGTVVVARGMGNYKSRPQHSCAEEFRKKVPLCLAAMPQVTELHAVLQQRVQADLAIPDPSHLTEVSCQAVGIAWFPS